jgi:hypothetical protein
VGKIKKGIWRVMGWSRIAQELIEEGVIMERLDWKNCKSIEITNNKDYDAVIELFDMPFEKEQEFIFDSENGLSRVCKVLKVRANKIYIEIGDEL